MSNSLDKDSVGPYLGPNCLQKLSVDDARRQRVISRGLSVMLKDRTISPVELEPVTCG